MTKETAMVAKETQHLDMIGVAPLVNFAVWVHHKIYGMEMFKILRVFL